MALHKILIGVGIAAALTVTAWCALDIGIKVYRMVPAARPAWTSADQRQADFVASAAAEAERRRKAEEEAGRDIGELRLRGLWNHR